MKSLFISRRLQGMILIWLFVGAVHCVHASTIAGTVYDTRRNGLPNVNVELLNSYHGLIGYTVTDGIGRYSFEVAGDGDYYVRALPFRYDFDEETQMVQITTISQVSNKPGYMRAQADFYLTPRKGTLAEARADVIFAQEIPKEARQLYEDGLKALKKSNQDSAVQAFQAAIKIFPDYFLANYYLGSVYFEKKDYEHAAPPLMKAAQVNERSGITLYYLGYSLHHLNYNKAAIIALQSAAIITPASPAIFTALGSAQRMERQYADAEKSLLQAKKLSRSVDSEIYKQLAAVYGETGQFVKGAESLEQMLKSGNFSDADAAKIKEQIKQWKVLAAKQPAKT